MKKYIMILIVICLSIGLFGCGIKSYEELEQELQQKEKECRQNGMYPYRDGCSSISSPTCHVVCMSVPQKNPYED